MGCVLSGWMRFFREAISESRGLGDDHPLVDLVTWDQAGDRDNISSIRTRVLHYIFFKFLYWNCLSSTNVRNNYLCMNKCLRFLPVIFRARSFSGWSSMPAWGDWPPWCMLVNTGLPALIYWIMISLAIESRTSWTWHIHLDMRFLNALCVGFLFPTNLYTAISLGGSGWVALRLAILFLLRADPNGFASHFGVKCSSFSKMNVGTSQRSACAPVGHTPYKSVALANKLLERIGFGKSYGDVALWFVLLTEGSSSHLSYACASNKCQLSGHADWFFWWPLLVVHGQWNSPMDHFWNSILFGGKPSNTFSSAVTSSQSGPYLQFVVQPWITPLAFTIGLNKIMHERNQQLIL